MGVDLQGDRQAGVAEDDLRITRRNTQGLQQGCDRVQHMMNLDEPDVVRLADAPDGPDEVPGLDRTARPS